MKLNAIALITIGQAMAAAALAIIGSDDSDEEKRAVEARAPQPTSIANLKDALAAREPGKVTWIIGSDDSDEGGSVVVAGRNSWTTCTCGATVTTMPRKINDL
ncbi:hypothetical protein B0H63DRAFT_518713 [Podospora didyma]|uniref:Uncharacterized protein n=1 Tax=Podospora didyma TaxID=330526 RepID=A0AAE0U3F9_9PEZI|nr:hypothetical protein B0H63DRAFT_530036 [Podospora didyma]KAK3389482.1 hypothetical protein B0H63DRAFT_518713 [Podospora didyma]